MNNFIAVYVMSNWGGLGIISTDGETVKTAFNFGNGVENISTAKIRYSARGDGYFIKFGKRYYLRDFMRV